MSQTRIDQLPEPYGQSISLAPETCQSTDDATTPAQNNSLSTSASTIQAISRGTPRASLINGPIRVPGTYPPVWLPDNETDTCMSCDNLFTLIKRRHHCRSCGKIFCGDCCRSKAKLLYMDNKEARVCDACHRLIEFTLSSPSGDININSHLAYSSANTSGSSPSTSSHQSTRTAPQKAHGVLKTSSHSRSNANDSQTSSSSNEQQQNKQVIFSDGVRPGTDLSESFPYPLPSSSTNDPSSASFSLLTRQTKDACGNKSSEKKGKGNKSQDRNITVCDELGYLPPIVISKNSPLANADEISASPSNSLTDLIVSHFKTSKNIQASMESRSCPLNGVVKFEEISNLVGTNNTVTFLLLKDFYLKVKIVEKTCCVDKLVKSEQTSTENTKLDEEISRSETDQITPKYWCFASDGLSKYGQNEILLVIDKDKDDPSIPRDIFKIYLTLHELSLRRQSLENLGNLLFQDGLLGEKGTAGLLFVRPLKEHCLNNLVLPKRNFLVALILQRWEIPWSKVFPMRLLLRLGHKYDVYPYPIISSRAREPVYYEIGHTIISILGDFKNFRYSLTHVEGLKVKLNMQTKKVIVQLDQSNYSQFNKVLDSANNEHVLAWSSGPFQEADGHLVSVQNEDGQYETVEFYKKTQNSEMSFKNLEQERVLGASFIIFSRALKFNQSGQSAKIKIIEDGLLIQVQSCILSALRNAIHYMHHFDIDCENSQDPLNRVEIDWLKDGTPEKSD